MPPPPSNGPKKTAYPVMTKLQKTAKSVYPTTAYPSPYMFDAIDMANVIRADRWRKEVPEARRQAKLKRIVKKTIIANAVTSSKYRSADGKPLSVKSFPLCGLRLSHLFDYGCPVAVNLYLRFLMEMSILFLIMFTVSLPGLWSNFKRNERRAACRALTRDATTYLDAHDTMGVGANASSAEALECGWAGLASAIRPNLTDPEWFLKLALGSCLEYTNGTDQMLPMGVPASGDPVFVSTPRAAYCSRGDDALSNVQFWMQLLNCVLFFGFLLHLRRVQRHATVAFDRERWTTSDYAACISGLDRLDDNPNRGVFADDDAETGAAGQESHLWADLEEMGIPRSRVVQIEVGRVCRQEVRDISAFGRLKIREEEIESTRRKRERKGQGGLRPKMEKELESIGRRMEDLRQRLDGHKQDPDVSTGHAFVVFLYEHDRNRFVELSSHKGAWSMASQYCACFGDAREGRHPETGANYVRFARSTSLKARMPTVDYAPEPDDVRWADLAVTEGEHNTRVMKTLLITLVLLALGFYLNFKGKRFQTRITQEGIGDGDAARRFFFVPSGASQEVRESLMRWYTLGTSLLSSLIPVSVNALMKLILFYMTIAEGHPTQTAVETALFSKLSLAYTFNTAILPFFVGLSFSLAASGRPVDQSWFETGGVVNEAFFLMISNALFVDLFKLIQPFAVFNRLRGYLVVSQARLNQLWAPPPMNLGELYAASLKTAALCLIYAPLWPPAYLITAAAMAFSFWCTKCAVSVWYRRPPMLSEELFQKMRSRLGLLMLLHTVVAAVGANAASSDAVRVGDLSDLGAAASSPVVAMFVLVALYELLDCPGCFNCVPGLRMFDQGSYAPTTLVDGEPIPYHDTTDADGAFRKGVEGAMGYEIDQYICPTARDNRAELTTDALISLVLRDFSFGSPDGGGGGGTYDMRAIKLANLGTAQTRHAHLHVRSTKYPREPPPMSTYPSAPPVACADVELGGGGGIGGGGIADGKAAAAAAATAKKKKAPPIMVKKKSSRCGGGSHATTATSTATEGATESDGGAAAPAAAPFYPSAAAATPTPMPTLYPSPTDGVPLTQPPSTYPSPSVPVAYPTANGAAAPTLSSYPSTATADAASAYPTLQRAAGSQYSNHV